MSSEAHDVLGLHEVAMTDRAIPDRHRYLVPTNRRYLQVAVRAVFGTRPAHARGR
jgi:hypothetical protein